MRQDKILAARTECSCLMSTPQRLTPDVHSRGATHFIETTHSTRSRRMRQNQEMPEGLRQSRTYKHEQPSTYSTVYISSKAVVLGLLLASISTFISTYNTSTYLPTYIHTRQGLVQL
ncbi:hypothetical protein M434DRAFT_169720 [Hypoxylon sp. CO27-5]|nr:hypothetical protein M434DRAFT_169720 [Hypoxylon sp. CO27-5]